MRNPWLILSANVFGFVVCFAAWILNGVLVTFLVQQNAFSWNEVQIGLLLGLPILTGSLTRFPLGILSDRYGGRIIFTLVLLISSFGMWYASLAASYTDFVIASLIFGIAGGSFAVGVAYVSACFEKEKQGLALGIFGSGNLGAGLTTLTAPTLLEIFTNQGQNLEGWRQLPRLYAVILAGTAVIYFLMTTTKINPEKKPLAQLLEPLASFETYRYSFYYFILFGGYVGLSQWLIVYYVSAYGLTIPVAGLLASCFTVPSALMRIVGGRLGDLFGARRLLRVVLLAAFIIAAFLSIPMMDVKTSGKGVQSKSKGVVSSVTESAIVVAGGDGEKESYSLIVRKPSEKKGFEIFPKKESWQEPIVSVGDEISKNQLIAKGFTYIYFQANVWIFSGIIILLGLVMGVGMAAVYKAIPEHFPSSVGVVGGIVGMIGSLGGFFYPVIFAGLLQWAGIWTVCWILLLFLIFLAMRVQKWEN